MECEPENPDFLYMLGDIQLQINLLEKAESSYRKVGILNPANPDIWVDLSEVVAERTGVQEALNIVQEACEKYPANAQNFYRSAAYLFLLGCEKESMETLETALSKDPQRHQDFFSYLPEAINSPSILALIDRYQYKEN